MKAEKTKYNIWMEGYLCAAVERIPKKAKLMYKNIEAYNFIEACKKVFKKDPYFKIIGNRPFYWVLGLYDNLEGAINGG